MRLTTTKLGLVTAAAACGLLALGNWHGTPTHAQAAPAAQAVLAPLTGTWTVDPMHTNINFAIRHFGISLVRGRFDDFSGTIIANAAHPEKSSVQVAIQAASIDTNVKMRDDDLRSPHYFDAAKYPQITFQSAKIEKGRHGDLVADGTLTLHGVSKEVALPFHVTGPVLDPFGASRIGMETEIHLNRSDFGVGGKDLLGNGDFAIGNDVDVVISLEAIPAKVSDGVPGAG